MGAACGQFADAAGLLHIALNTSKGARTYGSYHIQNVNAYIQPLEGLAAPLQGRRHALSAELPRMAAHD